MAAPAIQPTWSEPISGGSTSDGAISSGPPYVSWVMALMPVSSAAHGHATDPPRRPRRRGSAAQLRSRPESRLLHNACDDGEMCALHLPRLGARSLLLAERDATSVAEASRLTEVAA